MRPLLLAVTIYSAVPLLKNHERPRNIEVNELVRKEVEIDAFAGYIGSDQQSNRGLFPTEILDCVLKLFVIALLAMQCMNLLGFQLQVLLQPLAKKFQCFHALSKDNKAIIDFFRMPIEFAARTDQFEQ